MGSRKRLSSSHKKTRQGRTKFGQRGNSIVDKQRHFAADVKDIVAKSQDKVVEKYLNENVFDEVIPAERQTPEAQKELFEKLSKRNQEHSVPGETDSEVMDMPQPNTINTGI